MSNDYQRLLNQRELDFTRWLDSEIEKKDTWWWSLSWEDLKEFIIKGTTLC